PACSHPWARRAPTRRRWRSAVTPAAPGRRSWWPTTRVRSSRCRAAPCRPRRCRRRRPPPGRPAAGRRGGPGGPARTRLLRRWSGRVELGEELGAALGLIVLADGLGGPAEPVERAQEAGVLGVDPPHVTRAPPAVGAEAIEPPVVADPVGGVGLDLV